MRSIGAIVTALVLVFGCADRGRDLSRLPALSGEFAVEDCNSLFPARGWQFVHSIDFTMDNGYGTTVLGVTTLEPARIRCALLSVEGFTLFEALFDRNTGLTILRAVPPFDTAVFAEGLIADIRTIFLPPPGEMHPGLTQDGKRICRFTSAEGRIGDIIIADEKCPQIQTYSPDGLLKRLVTGRDCRRSRAGLIPRSLELHSYGRTGYTLKMNLLRTDKIP
ncbi:MAG TPA: hypothetical protein VJ969_00135 [Desulfopila sp.]|nr:hypothetical protein [Desulfopila sp.]